MNGKPTRPFRTNMVCERAGENRFVLTIDPAGGQIDDVSDTDGSCVTSCPTSAQTSNPANNIEAEGGGETGNGEPFAVKEIGAAEIPCHQMKAK